MNHKISLLLISNAPEFSDFSFLTDECNITIISSMNVKGNSWKYFDLVIVSGGKPLDLLQNTQLIEFIRSCSIPLVGICYGAQLIAKACGANLAQLSLKREGFHEIQVHTLHPMFKGKRLFRSYEKHFYAVQSIPADNNIIIHADSHDGIEVFEIAHKKYFALQFHPELFPEINEGAEILKELIRFLFPNKM